MKLDDDVDCTQVGDIGNYYGGLGVTTVDGKHYWSIEDWSGCDWQEIPKYLYDALVKFKQESE